MNKELKAEIFRRFGSQFAFAHAIGSHEATVSKVVRERILLDDTKKREWAAVLNAPVDQLFPN